MYFTENLNVTLNASVGVHQVKIGVNCSSGIKNVTANGGVIMQIDVQEINITDALGYVAKIEREDIVLQKELIKLKKKLKSLSNELEELKADYIESERQKNLLQIENKILKDRVDELKMQLNKTKEELKEKKNFECPSKRT